MSMPFYVSPEQLMKDRADFARKGIARGRSLVVVQYADGIVFVSENLSQALHKVSELYDRIAFAAVGRYNEFENLRIAGVRLADMRGYAYDRADVTGRGLANAYAQTLGTIFSSGGEKPYEVELFVAEVGDTAEGDSIYRLTYDGQVADEHGFAVMGGSAEQATTYLKEHYTERSSLDDAVRLAVQALGQGGSETRVVPASNLEVAVLDRTRSQQRKFKRLTAGVLDRILGGSAGGVANGDGAGGVANGDGDGDGAGGGGGTASRSDGEGGASGGGSTDPSGVDDPTDPTDTVSNVPPLEDPVSGEPNDPPVAPPLS